MEFTVSFPEQQKQLIINLDVTLFDEVTNTAANIRVKALIDTGATRSLINSNLAEKFNIVSRETVILNTAGDEITSQILNAEVTLPGNIRFQTKIGKAKFLNTNFDFVLGTDILLMGDFSISHRDGYKFVSFRMPPSDKPLFYTGEN